MAAQRGSKRMTNAVFWRAASTLLFCLLFAVAGTAAATEPPYKQALARGAYLEALPLAQAALAGAERGSPNWRGVALDLVDLHIQTGRYASAESMLADFGDALATDPGAAATTAYLRGLLHLEQERYAQGAAALHGKDHPAVAEVLSDYGLLLSFQDKFDEADAALQRALDIQIRGLGEKALRVSVTYTSLAMLEEARGNAAAARRYAERALKIQIASPNHPWRANALFVLALAKGAQQDSDGAIEALEQSLKIDRAGRGENHPYLAIASDELAALYEAKGSHEAALAARKTSFQVNGHALGADHAYTLGSQAALATAHVRLGAYPPAVVLLRDLVARLRAAGNDTSDALLKALNGLGEALQLSADFPGAETVYRQLLVLGERRFGTDHGEIGAILNNLGNILIAQGRYADAEPVLKRAVAVTERKLGRDHTMTGLALSNLGHVYLEQGLIERARGLLKRSLAVMAENHGMESLEAAKAINNLALAELLGGQYADSTKNFWRTISIIEKLRGPRHPDLTSPLSNVALALERLGRGAEGRAPLMRAISIAVEKLGESHAQTATLRLGMAKLLGGLGEYDEGQVHLDRVLATLSDRLGSDHPKLAAVRETLAIFDMKRDNRDGALSHLRQARKIFEKRAALAMGSPLLDATAELRKAKDTLMLHMTVLGRADTVTPEAVAEAFEVAQLTQLGAAATAVTRMAARSAAGDGLLAQRVRDRQDAADRWTRAEAALTEALERPDDERDPDAEARWRGQRDKAAELLAVLDTELARTFPRYRELVGIQPMRLTAAQSLLGPDEALMIFATIDEGTVMLVVRGKAAQLHLIDMGAADLAAAVDRVRVGLDPTQLSDISDLYGFDAATAHTLYRTLFAPAEEFLDGARHVFVVPDGALTSLPVGVLLTEAPKMSVFEFDDYRSMSWLANRFPISVLPSVTALRSLRSVASRPASRKAMLGVGDPLLDDHPRLNARTAAPARIPANQIAAARGRGAWKPGLFRGDGLANLRAVRSMASLPDTKDELEALQAALGGKASRLLLQDQATEAIFRARTDLAEYGILVFATHGLVGGDLAGLSEPALVLTPPDKATAEDDGLLTASEISTLSLNADWVVLSACNTASGDGDGEGLSGLAKAFFYAGSQALFVSHWPVASDAAVKLTTAMFRAQAANPGIGKAEAHRRAIAAVMTDRDNPMYAHPLFWAPFVVVGDGGVHRSN